MLHPQPHPSYLPIHLPELITAIGHHLSLKDLLSCVQVSRHWNQVLIPLLWHTIDDGTGSWQHILQVYDDDTANDGHDEAWLYSIFAKYGHHIRQLKTKWGIIVMAASTGGACQNLQSLITGSLYSGRTHRQLMEDNNIDVGTTSTSFLDPPLSDNTGSSQPSSPFTPQEPALDSTQFIFGGLRSFAPQPGLPCEPQFTLVSPIFEGVFIAEKPFSFGRISPSKTEHEWKTHQHLWLLVLQNPRLKALIFDDDEISVFPAFANYEFFYDTLGALKELTELKSLDDAMAEGKTWNNIRAFRPARCLHEDEPLRILKCFPNLEELKASWVYDRTRPSFGQGLLGQGFGGFGVSYENSNNNDTETRLKLESILGNTPTHLRRLSLSLDEKSLKFLPSLIRWCPDLIELTIPRLNLNIATTLAIYCPSLQVFRIGAAPSPGFGGSGFPRLEPNVANILFSNCRHLRVFDGIQYTIEIDLLQDQPWVCPNLEVLGCQFVGFNRLDMVEQPILESALRSPESVKGCVLTWLTRVYKKYDESKRQHELFFSTLAKLRNLRFLDMGQHCLDIDYTSFNNPNAGPGRVLTANGVRPVPNSPSLTLFYGLDQLQTLTKLEYLNFEGMDHRMGEQDITWIGSHWPKLKKFLGLHIVFSHLGFEWVTDYPHREILQRLRPDVQNLPNPGFRH
ncbi:hypothetical protein BGX23_003413 [Mortierella sp. AD031]|nr:hypothetical protein BGX23_003413 [Mortierella sp. AD031]